MNYKEMNCLSNRSSASYIFIASFIVSLLSSMIVYGFELTHFTLSIDEEFNDNILHTISMGRWGHALLKTLILPEPFVPFFTTLISLIALSLSSAVIVKSLKLDFKTALFFSILYIALPQFAYQLQFTNQSDTLAISILTSSLVVYFTFNYNSFISSIALPTLLYAFSISIYQSIVLMPVTLYFSHLAISYMRNDVSPANMKNTVKLIINSVSAVVLYSIITRVVQNYYGVSSDSYFLNLIGWLHADFSDTLHSTFQFILTYFTFNAPYGLNTFSLSSLIVIAFIAKIFIKNKKWKIQITVLAMLIVASAFIFNIIVGGYLAARAMTSLPLSFAIISSMLFIETKRKNVLFIFPVVILLCGTAASSRLFYSDYLSYNRDYRLASNISADIERTQNVNLSAPTKIYFFGGLDLQPMNKLQNSDMFSSSFLNWDGGNSARITAFMQSRELANIVPVLYSDLAAYREEIKTAPVWPKKGGIMNLNGIIVVKLGNNPGNCINGIYKNIDSSRCR